MLVIAALIRLRYKDFEFKSSLDYLSQQNKAIATTNRPLVSEIHPSRMKAGLP